MIRAAFFLTFALMVATGESAPLLCQALCDRAVPAEDVDACDHNQSTAQLSIANDADCTSIGPTAPMRGEPNWTRSHEGAPVFVRNEPMAATFGRAVAAAPSRLDARNRPRTVALRI